MKQVLTVRLDPEVLAQLDRLAAATARQRSFLVREAVRDYLAVNAWQVEAIREGVRQADAGEVIPHAKLKRQWTARCMFGVRAHFVVSIMAQFTMVMSACSGDRTCEHTACIEPICTSPCDSFESFGYCEPKTTRCCKDSDCPVGTCDDSTGYCLEYEYCHCFSDDTCPPGTVCFSSHNFCGVCISPPPACTVDTECEPGFYCKDQAYCQERCCEL